MIDDLHEYRARIAAAHAKCNRTVAWINATFAIAFAALVIWWLLT